MNKKFYLKKNILYIFLLTIIFSIIIFFIKNYFFVDENEQAEQKYIEDSFNYINSSPEIKRNSILINNKVSKSKISKEDKSKINQYFKEKKIEKIIEFLYVPEEFIFESKDRSELIFKILKTKIFNNEILDSVKIELNKEILDTRGKMKDKTVKLFGIQKMENEELLSVFIHEFCHYIDIYTLNNKVFGDNSYYFYDISWDDTKIIKKGQKQEDFVSGYAMTNKYEDFAETMTYYILHNFSFKEKSSKSIYLKEKYDFFGKYVFKNNQFKEMDFGTTTEIKNYYRDITKININITIFLQYLFKNI